jgi:hypothetical protein
MVLLLIIAAWIVVLSLVVALCAAARVGDLASAPRASSNDGTGWAQPYAWEPAPELEISAHVNVTASRSAQSASSPLRSDGIAA